MPGVPAGLGGPQSINFSLLLPRWGKSIDIKCRLKIFNLYNNPITFFCELEAHVTLSLIHKLEAYAILYQYHQYLSSLFSYQPEFLHYGFSFRESLFQYHYEEQISQHKNLRDRLVQLLILK